MKALTEQLELLGRGLYSVAEVARLVELSPSTVRRWVAGYQFSYQTSRGRRTGSSRPVVSAEVPILGGRRASSFVELVEILVVKAFLSADLPMKTIRRVARRAADRLGTAHPFAYRMFCTDGRDVYLEVIEESRQGKELVGLAEGQYAFASILDPYLKQLDFDMETLLAIRWWPLGKSRAIVLDPQIAFGEPVIADTRLPVSAVLDALRAGESRGDVERWFDLSPSQLEAAIEFGKKKAA